MTKGGSLVTTSDKARATIIRRLHEHGDFPAMAETVLRVNKLAADEDASAVQLANAILDDYALTNKVLRVVNSAIYGRSTEVTTISRAIVVMGWNPIRSLVLTLKLFDGLPESSSKDGVRELLKESFCTGMVARNVAHTIASVREEQAFICGLFHQFGSLLVHFYLPEAEREIQQIVASGNKKRSAATRLVLGMSYAEVGISVASELRFPRLLVACMNPKPSIRTSGRPTPSERLNGLTAFSGRIKTALLANTTPSTTQSRVAELFDRFERVYGPVGATPETVVTQTLELMEEHAAILGLPIRSEDLVGQIAQAYFVQPPPSVRVPQAPRSRPTPDERPKTSSDILVEGVAEAVESTPRSLNDVLLVVLESMFRGVVEPPVFRAVFLIRDPRQPLLRYRCGLGDDLDDAHEWFSVPLDKGRDLFSVAVHQNRDLFVSDVSALGVATAYPPVYRGRARSSAYAVLLPIAVRGKSIGVFFLEGCRPRSIEPKYVDLLKRLRDEVVRSIERASLLAA